MQILRHTKAHSLQRQIVAPHSNNVVTKRIWLLYSHVNILLCDTLEGISRDDCDPHVIGHLSAHTDDNVSSALRKLGIFIQKREQLDEL